MMYRLVDFYTLFYYRFVSNNTSGDEQWWTHNFESSKVYAWQGLTFETVCLTHTSSIKKALGISGMATSVSSWRKKADASHHGAQVDLVIERADRIIHLCEMKFSKSEYRISDEYARQLRERLGLFIESTKTRLSPVITFVTTFGVANGMHNSIVHSEVRMEDLYL